jgi:hypothetical protein
MSEHDDFFRGVKGRARRVAPGPEPDEPAKPAPLVTQGARGSEPRAPAVTPDSLIRGAKRSAGAWTRIIG